MWGVGVGKGFGVWEWVKGVGCGTRNGYRVKVPYGWRIACEKKIEL